MNIIRLEIKGLYGYIDKEIDFYNDITLLVGINGSGKTSLLNIIHWMIKPSIAILCVTEFKVIKLIFSYKSIRYTATCSHNQKTFKYELKSEKGKDSYNPLIVHLKIIPSEINNDDTLKANLIQEYSQLKPDLKEKKTWNILSMFPTPTIIGLDRNLYVEESEKILVDTTTRGKVVRKSSISYNTPQQRVKDLVNTEYRKSKNAVLNLTNNLKNSLMLSTFDGSITHESFNTGIKQKLDLSQIKNAEKRVDEYFNQFEKNSFSKKDRNVVKNYFSKLENITTQYQNNSTDETIKLLYGLNANQFIKVNKLLVEFEKFEIESNKKLEHINLFLNTINYFLKDSAKKLLFKEDTAEITFNTLDKNGNDVTDVTEFRDIKYLSSGEQQILILFAYLTFNSQDGRIFIIDEPELSLHIKWQEDFLEYLERITPKSVQLILATHSPILVGKKKEKAKVLFPYNT